MPATPFAQTPAPPYYAVIFSSRLAPEAGEAYGETAKRLLALAATMDGFLGVETTGRDPDGFGITISYWRDLEAIARWRAEGVHVAAQNAGRQSWYEAFWLRVARVERETVFFRDAALD